MTLSTIRHDILFNRRTFLLPIQIVGIGAAGSAVGEQVTRFGCGEYNEVNLWDGDTVAEHNRSSQKYVADDIGEFKTAALGRHIKRWGDVTAIEHREFIDGPRDLPGVVFVCVDKMSVRWNLWEQSIRRQKNVALMIETRMEASNILIHVVDPNNERHIKQWERYWYPDEEATNTFGCNGPASVCSTAGVLADIAVWQMIRFAAIKEGYEDTLDNQIKIGMRPLKIETYKW